MAVAQSVSFSLLRFETMADFDAVSSDTLDARPKDQLYVSVSWRRQGDTDIRPRRLFAGSGCVRKVTLSIRNPDAGTEDDEENSTTGSISGPAQRNSISKGNERRQGVVLPAGSGFSNIAGRRGKTPLSIRVLPTMVPVSWAKPPPELACGQTPETSNCSTPLPKYSTRENTPVVDADKSDAWLPTDHRTVQHNKQGYVLSYLAQQNGIASLRLPLLEGQAPASLTNPPPYGSTASLNGSPELSSAQASEAGSSTEDNKPPRGIRPLRLPAQVAKRNITPQKASPVLRPLLLPQDMAHRTEHMSRPSSVLTAVPESLEPQDVPRSTSKDAPVSPRMERILDLLDAAGVAPCDSALSSHPFDFSRIGREDSSSSIASTNGSMNTESTSYPEDLEAQQGIECWKHDIISAYIVSIPEMLVD